MYFRSALIEDLPAVCQFAQNQSELFFAFPKAQFPLTVDQVLPNFQLRQGNSVGLIDDKVVAFANFISLVENDLAIIGNVLVDPLCRGKGVGRALLTYMECLAKQRFSVARTRIPCFSNNSAGLLFYHALGYRPVDGEPRVNYDGKPVYLVYLEKFLN